MHSLSHGRQESGPGGVAALPGGLRPVASREGARVSRGLKRCRQLGRRRASHVGTRAQGTGWGQRWPW